MTNNNENTSKTDLNFWDVKQLLDELVITLKIS